MNQAPGDSGLELVLDNRKLIIGFVLLMLVCAAFFLFGFVEGKRQALEAQGERISAPAAASSTATVPRLEAKSTAVEPSSKPIEQRPVREQLDWYKSVKDKPPAETKAVAKAPPAARTRPAATKPKAAMSAKSPARPPAAEAAPPVKGEKVTYSVQVGAFKARSEADKKALELKAKGYQCAIAPTANGLFGIKVGRFESRADAHAMQLRLKKNGFTTIIKTN